MIRPRPIGVVLLVIGIAGLCAGSILAATPVTSAVTATIATDRMSFRFEQDLDDLRPFLTGTSTASLRLLNFDTLTTAAESVATNTGGSDRPDGWMPFDDSKPLVIQARAIGAQASFQNVRLNQIAIPPGTHVSLTRTLEGELSVILADQPWALSVTFPRDTVFECQQCQVSPIASWDRVWFRLQGLRNRTVFAEGDAGPLTLAIGGSDGKLFEGLLAVSDPTLIVSAGTLHLPDIRRESVSLASGATLTLEAPDGPDNRFRVTSLELIPQGIQVRLEGRARRVDIDGDSIRLTQLSAWSWLSVTLLATGTVLLLATGTWLTIPRSSPPVEAGRQLPVPAPPRDVDVFLSYASADRPMAKRIAGALAEQGWHVWWDRKLLAGDRFSEVIDRVLQETGCVVVLWSRAAVSSPWVPAEAGEGIRRGVLVPVLIEAVKPPLQFRELHTANLVQWQGHVADPNFADVVAAISAVLQRSRPATSEAASAGHLSSP